MEQQDNNNLKIRGTRILGDSVQIFTNGDHEYRIRKGVWNFEEATLNMEGAKAEIKRAMSAIFNQLAREEELKLDQLKDVTELQATDLEEVLEVLNDLTFSGYLAEKNTKASDNLLAQVLHGADIESLGFTPNTRPILFYSDSTAVIDYIEKLASDAEIPIEVLKIDEINEIANLDLTTRYEAYEVKTLEKKLCKRFDAYSIVVGCLERPRISFLRNLNRILVKLSKSSVLSMIDGPFSSIMTMSPPETGCFECYESRLMARMMERSVYKEYVDQSRDVSASSGSSVALLHGIASSAFMEGILLWKIGRSRLAGRIQSTYVPLLEIQMQDLLRVPYCPACGGASSTDKEMYASTDSIVETFEQRVRLT